MSPSASFGLHPAPAGPGLLYAAPAGLELGGASCVFALGERRRKLYFTAESASERKVKVPALSRKKRETRTGHPRVFFRLNQFPDGLIGSI